MADPLQLGFTDYEQIYAKKRTRCQRFLDEIEITVPWEAFLALIKPVYDKPSSKGGRPPIPLKELPIDDATIINAPSPTLTEAGGRAWRSH
ncbi:hypothetical protein VB734_01070 [Synechococcus sp. BA-124 BA4]|uniref:hypothetical protein n=1 Tax=unclassified Synechococcus TaxID=2626047 RepID=UPI002AD362D9|nr:MULTISPECIES: hypothetical protein [unclassified Synechococcus]MEA5398631.1 hypothetical protein [Synechococcus sp. BA-124 BA4]CAK6694726.1 hypothetical protein BBFGKLBO_01701 [Synechococcus sp. CBW1107]